VPTTMFDVVFAVSSRCSWTGDDTDGASSLHCDEPSRPRQAIYCPLPSVRSAVIMSGEMALYSEGQSCVPGVAAAGT